jgi:hypothetical protein
VLTAGLSCVFAISTKPSEESVAGTDVLTVFLTGNELGKLKPCGCSGGQLGGFDRRAAILGKVPPSGRMIVDTGSFVETDSKQDHIKFDVIVEALSRLDYDVVNLTEKDIEMAQGRGMLDPNGTGSPFNIISVYKSSGVNLPARYKKQFSLKNGNLAVTIASFDAESAPIERVRELFAPTPAVQTANILILNRCETPILDSIAQMGIVDCLVCPSESDEPQVTGEPNKRPLVVSVGRYGKYVAMLQIRPDQAGGKPNLRFSPIDVNEGLPGEQSLVELYKDYQQFVKAAELLEDQPRYPLPSGLEYVGSESCKTCHEYEYEKWSTKKHAHAYATLVDADSQYDPECIVCHVVGFEYESGFVTEQRTPHLKDVGCENCHGPGSRHSRSLGEEMTTDPKSDCTACHTPETSGEYLGSEQLYLQNIVHWREPNAAGNVK